MPSGRECWWRRCEACACECSCAFSSDFDVDYCRNRLTEIGFPFLGREFWRGALSRGHFLFHSCPSVQSFLRSDRCPHTPIVGILRGRTTTAVAWQRQTVCCPNGGQPSSVCSCWPRRPTTDRRTPSTKCPRDGAHLIQVNRLRTRLTVVFQK